MSEKVCVVYHDMLTTYGHGISCCVDALFQNRTNFLPVKRFEANMEVPAIAACFPEGLFPEKSNHIAEQSVMYLLDFMQKNSPFSADEIPCYFALTQGEISELENAEQKWTAKVLIEEIGKQVKLHERSRIFSASCASGNIALARAAAEIASENMDQVLVIGCDVVSEFTFSGFFSVHAITPDGCRPYDISHNGLFLGDAAGVILLASERKAKENNWKILATIEGYGITTDSYHAAAPDPEGIQMAAAMEKAIAGTSPEKLAAVIGHGTGTALNDNMELAALNRVFPEGIPLASVKGGTGHILAASGIIQTSCAIECLNRNQLFPQTSLLTPEKGAERFVSDQIQPLNGDSILTLNAGFGGLTAVIRVGRA